MTFVNRYRLYLDMNKVFFKTQKYGFSFSIGYSWVSNAYKVTLVLWNYAISLPLWIRSTR